MPKNKKKKKLQTINSFLKKKDKLITALGVFIALTIFSESVKMPVVNVNFRSFDDVLSYCFFSCSILICLELWITFPKEKESKLTLKFFKYFISFGSLSLVIIYISTYYINYKPFFDIGILITLMTVVMKLYFYLVDKYRLHSLFKNKIISIISFLASFVAASLLILLLYGIAQNLIDFLLI